MMKHNIGIIVGVAGLVMVCGCKKDPPAIDAVPVEEIVPSEPPVYEVPVKKESPYGPDGVYKASEKRYYNVVTPVYAEEISCENESCSFFVPGMMMTDITNFLKKYFPYQEFNHYPAVDVFEISPKIKPEFEGDAVVPELDPNVQKPSPETAVEIKVYWNRRENKYIWVYSNPMLRLNPPEVVDDPNEFDDEIPPEGAVDDPPVVDGEPGTDNVPANTEPQPENADIIPETPGVVQEPPKEHKNMADELNEGLREKGVVIPDTPAPEPAPSEPPANPDPGNMADELNKGLQENK
ncbi:MAG: hypothetical protein IJM59_05525 [Proteobacteria bacterium]|nr:hypothetical protein [Pseudomonadota bacterium]